MTDANGSARVMSLSEIEPIPVAGGLFHPVRRMLGVRAFGINAYSARAAGEQVIEPHDETGTGSGGHEELYLVLSGRATFSVDGDEHDAPAGTLVFVSDVHAKRSAVASEEGTVVLVVGGPADRPLPVSPFEYWFVAEGPYRRHDFRQAVEIASEGFTEWPDHPVIHFQLACYEARDGRRDEALRHLALACAGEPRAKEWARTDSDFDSVRDEPAFAEMTA